MKLYLLIAGYTYYPSAYTGDWIACFETYEEAQNSVIKKEKFEYFKGGKNKGQIKTTLTSYVVNDEEYDWYDIVDLKDWIGR